MPLSSTCAVLFQDKDYDLIVSNCKLDIRERFFFKCNSIKTHNVLLLVINIISLKSQFRLICFQSVTAQYMKLGLVIYTEEIMYRDITVFE